MAEIHDAFAATRKAGEELGAATAEVRAAADEAARLRTARAKLTRGADPRDPAAGKRLAELDERIAEAEAATVRLRDRRAVLEGDRRRLLDRFGELADPLRTDELPFAPETPVLLLPVRLETRFAPSGDELWVRVYPDAWAVDAFEPTLSEVELASATRFWASWWRAAGDEDQRRAAWRGLVASHGSGRGGWITRQHRPENEAGEPVRTSANQVFLVVPGPSSGDAGVRAAAAAYWAAVWRAGSTGNGDARAAAEAALDAAVAPDDAAAVRATPPTNLADPAPGGDAAGADVQVVFLDLPALDPADVKLTSWTAPATARVLPDRFVLLGYQGDTEVLHETGNPVPPELVVGPDPSAAPTDQLRVDERGDLSIPDELAWMVDFDRAVRVGMGFRVRLDERTSRGFDRLFVLGIRQGAAPEEDAKALEELLARHHHSRSGFAVVPQGAPTNNTEQAGAAWDRTDDPDASYPAWLGAGSGLTHQPHWTEKQDGQWLAECLGIDPAVLATVPGAAGTDQVEARAANTALWPATWGYYLDTMLHPVVSDRAVAAARAFFLRYVSGRGLVPAVRLGRQPYGILPTTAWSRFTTKGTPRQPLDDDPLTPAAVDRLGALVGQVAEDWQPMADGAASLNRPGDPHQALLDVLGLHPTSVEFHQRYAESLEDLVNRLSFDGLSADFYTVFEAVLGSIQARNLLVALGAPAGADPDLLDKVFHGAQQLLKGPLVDDRPLSETDPVRAYTDDGRNYLRWLADAARTSLDAVRRQQGFTGNKAPTAVLYLLLRHALMQSWWEASWRFRLDAGLVDRATALAAKREATFVHVRAGVEASESRYQSLYAAEPALTGSDRPLAEFVMERIDQRPAAEFREGLDALTRLLDVPTARLERVLVEHLDTCSFRLDAWRLGFVHQRLALMRNLLPDGSTEAKRGVHLGAYGWLEHVRPEKKPLEAVKLTKALDEAFTRPGDPPLLRDTTSGGYVHAPSLDHAATAAVLRSGYLANATPAQPDVMAVNISSHRMRLARGVIEGIRNGQPLGALLGYRLERGLHDRHGLAEVDRFIQDLRRAFPSPGDRDGRLPVDGLDLVTHIRTTGVATYPFGQAGLPAATAAEAAAINLEVQDLLDVHDAVADLALAEGVHQGVLGNVDRVAATLDAYSKGGFPPEPAVLETPRTGAMLTHRFGLHLRPGLDHTASPVTGVAMTPRATAEPAVNDLVARLIPAPADVVVRVTWTDRAGAPGARVVSAADLALQPADLLAVVQLGGQAMTELDERIVDATVAAENLPVDVAATVRLRYTEPVPGKTTLFELAPLLAQIRSLVGRSRPLRASDVLPPAETTSATDAEAAVVHRARPAAVLAALATARTAVAGVADTLAPLLDEPADPAAARATLAAGIDGFVATGGSALARLASFGVAGTGRGDLHERRLGLFHQILGLVGEVADRWTRRLADADTQLAADAALPSTASDEERNRILALAERDVSTARTDPLPTADQYRTIIETKRATFAARLAQLQGLGAATSVSGLLAAVESIGPWADLDPVALDLTPALDGVVALADLLRTRVAAAVAEADQRQAAASAALAEHDAATSAAGRVEAVTAATKALLGPDAVVVPEFTLPAELADEWEAAMAWSRTGGLLTHLTATRPYAVDDWLLGVARVREKVHAWEQAAVLAAALGRPEPALTPVQFPHAAEPWVGLELAPDTSATGDRTLYTAHYPVPFDKVLNQCGLLLDEWTETIPGESVTTGLAFHHDSPNCEAPQAMLLAVPPTPTDPWRWRDLVDTLHDTLDLARVRAIEPAQIDGTPYANLLPATITAATVSGINIAVNYALNNDLLRVLEHDDG